MKVAPEEPCDPFRTGDDIDDLPFEQPSTITAFYKVVATKEELAQVEMAFNSIGIPAVKLSQEAYNALVDIYNESSLSMKELASLIILESVDRIVYDKED